LQSKFSGSFAREAVHMIKSKPSSVLFNRGSAKHVVEWGSVRVPRFIHGKWFLASVCWCVIIKFFRSPCRIQTPSRSVSYTGGLVQIAEQEILRVVASFVVHCCAVKKNVIVAS